ncbi:hypothetical protein K502DRAFT_341257 [Neoconidiobolus thromboides FSU 785]|nr:hypothetical protein K502DRAFT_341257 [Neoconidiobolus thromboides FSU 785]
MAKNNKEQENNPPNMSSSNKSDDMMLPNINDKLLATSRVKLRNRFEGIIKKYGKDFTNEADEIDIFSEMVIVDKGHMKKIKELEATIEKMGLDKAQSQNTSLTEVDANMSQKTEFKQEDIDLSQKIIPDQKDTLTNQKTKHSQIYNEVDDFIFIDSTRGLKDELLKYPKWKRPKVEDVKKYNSVENASLVKINNPSEFETGFEYFDNHFNGDSELTHDFYPVPQDQSSTVPLYSSAESKTYFLRFVQSAMSVYKDNGQPDTEETSDQKNLQLMEEVKKHMKKREKEKRKALRKNAVEELKKVKASRSKEELINKMTDKNKKDILNREKIENNTKNKGKLRQDHDKADIGTREYDEGGINTKNDESIKQWERNIIVKNIQTDTNLIKEYKSNTKRTANNIVLINNDTVIPANMIAASKLKTPSRLIEKVQKTNLSKSILYNKQSNYDENKLRASSNRNLSNIRPILESKGNIKEPIATTNNLNMDIQVIRGNEEYIQMRLKNNDNNSEVDSIEYDQMEAHSDAHEVSTNKLPITYNNTNVTKKIHQHNILRNVNLTQPGDTQKDASGKSEALNNKLTNIFVSDFNDDTINTFEIGEACFKSMNKNSETREGKVMENKDQDEKEAKERREREGKEAREREGKEAREREGKEAREREEARIKDAQLSIQIGKEILMKYCTDEVAKRRELRKERESKKKKRRLEKEAKEKEKARIKDAWECIQLGKEILMDYDREAYEAARKMPSRRERIRLKMDELNLTNSFDNDFNAALDELFSCVDENKEKKTKRRRLMDYSDDIQK